MSTFRICLLTVDDLIHSEHEVICSSEVDALASAAGLLGLMAEAEIWSGEQFIGRVFANAPTFDRRVAAICDKVRGSLPDDPRDCAGHTKPQNGSTSGRFGISPAENGANLLKQTRMFSRSVNQLQADMEKLIGKPTRNLSKFFGA